VDYGEAHRRSYMVRGGRRELVEGTLVQRKKSSGKLARSRSSIVDSGLGWMLHGEGMKAD
jgi:hypothetical protein